MSSESRFPIANAISRTQERMGQLMLWPVLWVCSPQIINHQNGPKGLQWSKSSRGVRSTACKTWTASWVNPWAGMVRASEPQWMALVDFPMEDWPSSAWDIPLSPIVWRIIRNMKYLDNWNGDGWQNMRDQINQEKGLWHCFGGKPHDQPPVDHVDPVDWLLSGKYEPSWLGLSSTKAMGIPTKLRLEVLRMAPLIRKKCSPRCEYVARLLWSHCGQNVLEFPCFSEIFIV